MNTQKNLTLAQAIIDAARLPFTLTTQVGINDIDKPAVVQLAKLSTPHELTVYSITPFHDHGTGQLSVLVREVTRTKDLGIFFVQVDAEKLTTAREQSRLTSEPRMASSKQLGLRHAVLVALRGQRTGPENVELMDVAAQAKSRQVEAAYGNAMRRSGMPLDG